MSEKLIFGVIIPAVTFLVSFLATVSIYRRFARHGGSSHPERNKKQ